MSPVFAMLAAMTLASAIAAMSFRKLVHSALSMILTFSGLASIYLHLNAQFVGLVQVLVYVGAVAILVVFAILLTRDSTRDSSVRSLAQSWLTGLLVAGAVFGTLATAIIGSRALDRALPQAAEITVKKIGEQLMTRYIIPLEVIALLLTAAMIGAVIIAMREKERK
ncbi:MAG: NADH-quinone oxidoreductase subunit J [Pedosphaera sp.]|nr:NADH-quinone oxidoreductase subunit J [Pedosphaera sp.]